MSLSPLELAEAVARAAGTLLLARSGAHHDVGTKSSPTDLVSETDLASEALIRDMLLEHAPGDGIVGEEGDDVASTSGRRWIVDPLDGTVNFLYGHPQWCVSIACEGICGVIYDPLRDELFAGAPGQPTTLNGAPVASSTCGDLSTALVATGFGYDATQRGIQGDLVARILPHCRDIRRDGSAALDLAWVSAGRMDAYFEHGVKRWDFAAGIILAQGAGLAVRKLRARDGLPAGVMAAPPAIADALFALVD